MLTEQARVFKKPEPSPDTPSDTGSHPEEEAATSSTRQRTEPTAPWDEALPLFCKCAMASRHCPESCVTCHLPIKGGPPDNYCDCLPPILQKDHDSCGYCLKCGGKRWMRPTHNEFGDRMPTEDDLQDGGDRREPRQQRPPKEQNARRRGNHSGRQSGRRGDARRARERGESPGGPPMRGSGSGDGGSGGGGPPAPPPTGPSLPRVRPGKVGWIPLPFYNKLNSDFKRQFSHRWMYAFRHTPAVHPRSHIILMEDAELQIDYDIRKSSRRHGKLPIKGTGGKCFATALIAVSM